MRWMIGGASHCRLGTPIVCNEHLLLLLVMHGVDRTCEHTRHFLLERVPCHLLCLDRLVLLLALLLLLIGA